MYLRARLPFKLELLWLRSQAFRWVEREGWYFGVVNGCPVKVRQSGDGIEFRSSVTEESIERQIESYLGLNSDILTVHEALRRVDTKMAGLVECFGGMRILRQDPWECLVSYICSQNNNIDRIARIVEVLADRYGVPQALEGVKLNSFPTPQRLLDVGETELNSLSLGLNRGGRIHSVARDIVQGELDLDALRHLPYTQAKGLLMSYNGIGPKIADCVCLFSLHKAEAFPVDRHIAAALWEHYGKKYTSGAKNMRLLEWAKEYFGSHAGYAGQLLFYERLLRMEPISPEL